MFKSAAMAMNTKGPIQTWLLGLRILGRSIAGSLICVGFPAENYDWLCWLIASRIRSRPVLMMDCGMARFRRI